MSAAKRKRSQSFITSRSLWTVLLVGAAILFTAIASSASTFPQTRLWGSELLQPDLVGESADLTPQPHWENGQTRYLFAHDCALATRGGVKINYHPRIRARGVQDGIAHNFPYSFDKTILSSKGITLPRGGTGYAVRGVHNGKNVVYNMVVKDGVVVHRDFVSAKNWAQRSKSFKFNVGLDDLPGM